jgi:multidrug efflux system membrane fusion protein
VIQNNTAHLQNIKPGTEDNGMTAVTGINPNDVLANSSFERLQDKAQVKVTNTPIPGSANSENNAP